MNITTIVFAHGSVIETVKRHIPIWKNNTDNLLIVSPKDNPCVIEGIDCLTHEKSQHHGIHTLKRQLFAMKHSLLYKSDFYVFMEYDSILLKKPKYRNIIQGNLFNENIFFEKQHESMNKGQCFIHFPWIFPLDKLINFVNKVILNENDNTVHDIWLIKKLMELNFDVHNLLGLKNPKCPNGLGEGYSQNSFDTEDKILNAIYHVKNGAYALHGIKTESALNRIIDAFNQNKAS
jgi:hypothetical protein